MQSSTTTQTLLKQAYDPELFRQQGHQLIDLLSDYLNAATQGEQMPILPWKQPDQQLEDWKADLAGPLLDQPFEFFQTLLKDSTHIHHPNCIGHQVVPPMPLSALPDLISAVMNNGTGIYEMGPVSNVMERLVCFWLADQIGMPAGTDGFMTSGGSLGNLTALLAARQALTGRDIWKEGTKEGKQLVIMVSEEAHYCVARSAKIMGLGEAGLALVPTDHENRMKSEELERLYADIQAAGQQVLAVVGSACTTSTGSYDPLEEIADFCDKYELWFHVDGAHGGAAIVSQKYKHLVAGMERADSLIIDFHKMMMVPALTTAILFKEPLTSFRAFSQQASYLLDEDEYHWYDSASRTMECTKNMMGVKLYMILRLYGNKVFEQFIDHTYDLAQSFAQLLKTSDDFELALSPQANILCFRYHPQGIEQEQLNSLNVRIRQQCIEDGEFYIVQTKIAGIHYLRTTIMNPFTELSTLEALLAHLRKLGQGLLHHL